MLREVLYCCLSTSFCCQRSLRLILSVARDEEPATMNSCRKSLTHNCLHIYLKKKKPIHLPSWIEFHAELIERLLTVLLCLSIVWCKCKYILVKIKYKVMKRMNWHLHNGIDSSAIPLPHGSESWLSTNVPHLDCHISLGHLPHIESNCWDHVFTELPRL